MLQKLERKERSSIVLRKVTNAHLKSARSSDKMSVTSKVTLPKELYRSNNITKENKSQWENTSRKIRAIIPIFVKNNNEQTRKDMRKIHSRRKSIFSIFSKSSRKSRKSNKSSASESKKSVNKSVKSYRRVRQKDSRKSILRNVRDARRSTLFTRSQKLIMRSNQTPSSKKTMELKESTKSLRENREAKPSSDSEIDEMLSTIMNTTEIDEEIINQGCLVVVNQFGTQKSKYMIDPDHTYKGMWDLFNFILIAYQCVVTPFRICFDQPPEGFTFYVELLMDLVFVIDILVCFNVGYYHKGTKVMVRKKVIFNYIFGWLILDIVASFPYSYAMEIFIDNIF